MKSALKINSRQKQIIIGTLLGDGCLETANGKTYRLKIEHSFKQKDYVDWFFQELKNLASSPPKIKKQRVKEKWYLKSWFNSHYSGSLRFYAQQFYPQGKKIAPPLIKKWLTPLALAVWFMDDGSVKSKQCQGKIINTHAFDDLSLKRLREALEQRFQLSTVIRRQKEGNQLYLPASETPKLKQIIGSELIPSMKYKLD